MTESVELPRFRGNCEMRKKKIPKPHPNQQSNNNKTKQKNPNKPAALSPRKKKYITRIFEITTTSVPCLQISQAVQEKVTQFG